MNEKPTHFKYTCRICKTPRLQAIDPVAPETTPIPTCCGKRKDMAFQGMTVVPNT